MQFSTSDLCNCVNVGRALRYDALVLCVFAAYNSRGSAQVQEDCPMTTVGLYSGNSWGASTGSSDAIFMSKYCSSFIYRAISGDSSSNHVYLLSAGAADSTENSNAGDSVACLPLIAPPDSVGGTTINYLQFSSISGSPGNYLLTVTLEDGHTRHHIVDGTSGFSSSTDTNSMGTACGSALASILPIITTINNYEKGLNAADPSLYIDPEIIVTPSAEKIALKAGINVSIQITDCDGTPLPNRILAVKTKDGTLQDSTVTTDQNGHATDLFIAGSKNQFGIITATIANAPTVRYDTVSSDGFAVVTVGNPVDTVGMCELNYSMRTTSVSFLDRFTNQKDTREDWTPNATASTNSADGVVILPVTFEDHGTILLNSSDGDSLVFSTGKMSEHDFTFVNGWITPSAACKDDHTNMEGTTHNGRIASSGASVILEYGPTIKSLDCSAWYNYEGPYYLYGFAFDDCEDLGPPSKLDLYDVGTIVGEVNDSHPGVSGTMAAGFAITSVQSKTKSKTTFDPTTGPSSAWDSITTASFSGYLRPVSKLTSIEKPSGNTIPTSLALRQNYPNPLNPSTVIAYDLPVPSLVTLKVYDILGREVATLVTEKQNAGSYTDTFDGSRLSSGVYFYRTQAGPFAETGKFMLVK